MKHALSMVSFRVYKAADYEGVGKLTKIVLKDVNATGTTLSKGTNPKMNITTGVITKVLHKMQPIRVLLKMVIH